MKDAMVDLCLTSTFRIRRLPDDANLLPLTFPADEYRSSRSVNESHAQDINR
jgi:hypothetical protein